MRFVYYYTVFPRQDIIDTINSRYKTSLPDVYSRGRQQYIRRL